MHFNTLRPRQDGRHFADDVFKCIFLNKNLIISPKISLKFVPKGRINNIPVLVEIMAWRRPGDKPLSEPMMVRLPTHICVSRPQWVDIVTIHQRNRLNMFENLKEILENHRYMDRYLCQRRWFYLAIARVILMPLPLPLYKKCRYTTLPVYCMESLYSAYIFLCLNFFFQIISSQSKI